MLKLTHVSSIAAPLPESDIDTDAIFPARFLLLLSRVGLGKHLFHERRQAKPGQPPFVLDQRKFEGSKILITGARFGIGSSREHAVWALSDFGIRCIIAPSFGDIFYANCLKNGLLPICLSKIDHQIVLNTTIAGETLTIDLETQEVRLPSGKAINFDISHQHKYALLHGLDEVDSILVEDGPDITAFETRQRAQSPWLHLSDEQLSSFTRASSS